MSQDIHSIIERLKELHEPAFPLRVETLGTEAFIMDALPQTVATANLLVPENTCDHNVIAATYLAEAANALPVLLEYISHLEEALKPFARLGASTQVSDLNEDVVIYRTWDYFVVAGDFERAKALIEEGK